MFAARTLETVNLWSGNERTDVSWAWFPNVGNVGAERMSCERLLQATGPATQNARLPSCSLVLGTTKSPRAAKRYVIVCNRRTTNALDDDDRLTTCENCHLPKSGEWCCERVVTWDAQTKNSRLNVGQNLQQYATMQLPRNSNDTEKSKS